MDGMEGRELVMRSVEIIRTMLGDIKEERKRKKKALRSRES